MRIAIRDWFRSDLANIGALWRKAYEEVRLPEMPLRRDAKSTLNDWLSDRLRDRAGFGYVAEVDDDFAGFLLGRVGDWESDPPILKVRRVGIIDVLYVAEDYRRRGVATRLVERAIERCETRGVRSLETTFETNDPAAATMWKKLGFVSWIERAYRPTREQDR